jgi:predicted DNA binding protein
VRRLIIEVDAAEFARLSGDRSIEKIESLEVLNFLKEEPEEFVTICRLKLKDERTTIVEAFNEAGSEVQVLDHDREGRYTAIFRGRPHQDPQFRRFLAVGGYLSTPLEISNGKVRVTFLGGQKQVSSLLAKVKRMGVRHRIVQLIEANSSRSSPLDCLTDMQRRVITSAFELGYYDAPKKINTAGLAEKLSIRGSTLAMHRIKAEHRLLAEILKKSRN